MTPFIICQTPQTAFTVGESDYILGVADLTGEMVRAPVRSERASFLLFPTRPPLRPRLRPHLRRLLKKMRMCINNIGDPEGKMPFAIMGRLREIFDGPLVRAMSAHALHLRVSRSADAQSALPCLNPGFKALPPSAYNKDMRFKVDVMTSSLKKVEDGTLTPSQKARAGLPTAAAHAPRVWFTLSTACYTLKVRGTEIPKDQLHKVLSAGGGNAD